MIPLERYFAKIGFNQQPEKNLATLAQLQQLHPQTIPFENLDVLQGLAINLSPEALTEKLINQSRGGYCFEQNGLMLHILRALGYEVIPLLSRVLWNLTESDPPNPRTHMVLKVKLNHAYWLMDVGFGSMQLTAPLRWDLKTPQSTQHETFRLTPQKHTMLLEVNINEQWRPVYAISPDTQHPVDIEVANWYTSQHPDSKFKRVLMMSRVTETTRYTLLNNQLTIRTQNKPAEKIRLNTNELPSTLNELFLINFDDVWMATLENLEKIA